MAPVAYALLGAMGILLGSNSEHLADGMVVSARIGLDRSRGSPVDYAAALFPDRHVGRLRDGTDPLEYLAEHMFFFNRAQHIGMHHLGPLLIALAWPEQPSKLACRHRCDASRSIPSLEIIKIVQQPVIAAVLFVGLVAFWLIPSVHFRAMINPNLFTIMNWSMVVDGILFWGLVLDPRSKPPARVSFGARAALAMVVMFPQILIGAIIALTSRDLYPFYDLCGRLYPAIGAGSDQTIGGLIIWIPAAMMSVLAMVLVINAVRRFDEAKKEDDYGDDTSGTAIQAGAWTGR